MYEGHVLSKQMFGLKHDNKKYKNPKLINFDRVSYNINVKFI